MEDWTVVALRFGAALALSLAFGLPLQSFLAREPITVRWPVLLSVATALVLSIASLLALTAAMAGAAVFPIDHDMLAMVVRETALGGAFVVRFAALGLALGMAALPGPVERTRLSAIVGATGVAMATMAWTGHGAMDEGLRGAIHLTADIVHLIAAGGWIGAIAILLSAVAGRRRGRDPAEVRTALSRFATTGSVLVGSIALSGAINAWLIMGSDGIRQTFQTDYGVLLAAKTALFGAMLAIAAANRWVLTPFLERSIATGHAGAAMVRLRISLIAELTCAVIIVAIVARLGTLSPSG